MISNPPSKSDLKAWIKHEQDVVNKAEAKIASYKSLLAIAEPSAIGLGKKTRKRKKQEDTIEFESKVREIFVQNGNEPLQLQALLAKVTSLYPDGRMTEEAARTKMLHLRRSGFLVTKFRGLYQLPN